MDFFSTIVKILKPKKSKKAGEKASSSVINPVNEQSNENTSSPNFVTNVTYNCPNPGAPGSSATEPSLTIGTEGTEPTEKTLRAQSVNLGISISADSTVEWVLAKAETADDLENRALVGGYDYDGCPLWVIRTRLEGNLLPGKLNITRRRAYTAWNLDELTIGVFEVCCIPKNKVMWVDAENGSVPENAIVGGRTSDGEKLYIGRATYDQSLIPGKVQPSHQCCYVTYNGKAHPIKIYEVLCAVTRSPAQSTE